jgi:hypothetical protein
MGGHGARIAGRLRRGLRLGRAASPAGLGEPAPAAALRGLGEPPAPAEQAGPSRAPEQAGEAELDTLRGELVRELDRLAEGDDGSGSFRRIAS